MASLGNDLAQIRKKRNLTLDDLQEATKIPKRILRSIEDDSIFTDLKENPTYIRSYIRGYAKAISIDDKQIIKALDKWEIGNYSGSLQKLEDIDPSPSEPEDKEQETEQPSSDQDDDMVHDHLPAFKFEENDQTAHSSHKTSSQSTAPGIPERSDIRSIDWAEMGRQFQPLKSGQSKIWLTVLIVLVIGASGFFFFFFDSGKIGPTESQTTTPSQESSSTLSTDSLELNVTPSTDDDTTETELTENANMTPRFQNRSLDALPDTLSMTIYAAYGKLEPVRVYTDIMGDINPYWIEQGDAMRFNFVNEIRIRGQYNNLVLAMNGHVIQNFRNQFYNPETRLIEITRSYFEDDPTWLQPAPDSLEIDAPSPSVIRERPTFN
jgi:cytoskeletal protein RodZ